MSFAAARPPVVRRPGRLLQGAGTALAQGQAVGGQAGGVAGRCPASEAAPQVLGQQPCKPRACTQDTGLWACVWPCPPSAASVPTPV